MLLSAMTTPKTATPKTAADSKTKMRVLLFLNKKPICEKLLWIAESEVKMIAATISIISREKIFIREEMIQEMFRAEIFVVTIAHLLPQSSMPS